MYVVFCTCMFLWACMKIYGYLLMPIAINQFVCNNLLFVTVSHWIWPSLIGRMSDQQTPGFTLSALSSRLQGYVQHLLHWCWWSKLKCSCLHMKQFLTERSPQPKVINKQINKDYLWVIFSSPYLVYSFKNPRCKNFKIKKEFSLNNK